ncbi:MAG: flagellar hook-basal body complex protein [Candidatus Marinimicrobia bacterium]|nr:flagellar hook-basal body complex protein [Candidatus Neomarinimicrobiota bacterium]
MNEALSSALAGLQGQMRTLELLGSNIANINTIGYKSSRMTFLEALGQVIDVEYTPFAQGDLEATGFQTDLAIRGESFFVVDTHEDDRYFTRAGAFFFDQEGTLVNSSGYTVQGWMANINGEEEVQTLANLEDITLDSNLKAEALATQNLWLSGNLSSGMNPVAQIWTAGFPFTTAASDGEEYAVGATELNDLDEISGAELLEDGDQIVLTGTDDEGGAISTTFTYGLGNDGTTLDDLLAVINNTTPGVGWGAFAQASLVDGKVVLEDDVPGDSETSINMYAEEANAGSLSIPYYEETSEGFTGRVSTSAVIYDTLGESHNLVFEFVKTENPGQWTWTVTPSGDEQIDSENTTGSIYFNDVGQVTSFIYDNGYSRIEMQPESGGAEVLLQVHVSGADQFTGITQFNSTSTLSVREHDGRSTGELTGYEIEEDGSIMGSFSNGVSLKLAQIAVAEFTNPSALAKVSGSNFIETIKSGEVHIGKADKFGSTVEQGYLELSNVDVAEQFSQIIEAQRAFQASSRVLSTLNQVIQESTKLGL